MSAGCLQPFGRGSLHRGVQSFTGWLEAHRESPGVELQPPATTAELSTVEDRTLSPLPADLRVVLGRTCGARLPSGTLLSARTDGPLPSIQQALSDLSEALQRSPNDPEMLLPFFQSDDGGLLAFDRSAGPVPDTWPIVDYYPENGELRLVYRTFDGFCRVCVADWTADDFEAPFSLKKYLESGKRHARIEPDVSVAHATVAHALRRAGRPESALRRYLLAARCVPALPWCDWEALKIAALLGDTRAGMEAAGRLCARAPAGRWAKRETTPLQVADVLGYLAASLPSKEPVLRLFDQLSEQVSGDSERAHIAALRKACFDGSAPPPPVAVRPCAVAPDPDLARFKQAIMSAYEAGQVRDDDLLLEPAYAPLRERGELGTVLRVARDF